MAAEDAIDNSPTASNEDAQEEAEDEYVVEKIVDKRIANGTVKYLVKWTGWPDSDNTWEARDNLENCKDLVEKFELRRKAEKRAKEGKAAEDKRVRGFDRGLEPERIIGATDSSGQLLFLIKWAGSDEADLVPAKEANVKCPQTVIKFYEDRLTWHGNDKDDD